MRKTRVWLIALVAILTLVSACGPQLASPTSQGPGSSPSPAAVNTPATGPTPGAVQPTTDAVATVDVGQLPVDPNDWRALGPADAAVTVIEYSDFQ